MGLKYLQDNFESLLKTGAGISVITDKPLKELYHFKGQLMIDDTSSSATMGGKNGPISYLLDLKNFIHRGCMVKHSGKVYALIIATGKETKIMLNQGRYKLKKSRMEFSLNILVICNIFLLLCLDALMTGLN